MRHLARLLATAGLAWLSLLYWQRTHPGPCSYKRRFWVQLPKPFIRREWLRRMLVPGPEEEILELGPGTGYYALHVARWLGPSGRLHVYDIQQVMLDHTMRAAREEGLENLVPTRGDAVAMPYDDASFDAAYVMLALGEIPDQEAALRELHRVLRPEGRLVVGELFGDPHMVRFAQLTRRAAAAGFRCEERVGGPLGYVARLRPS